MIVLFGLIFVTIWTTVLGIALAMHSKSLEAKKQQEKEKPSRIISDDAPVASNVASFRVYEGSNIHEALGKPTLEGDLVQTNMESGKPAIFVLDKITYEKMGYVTIKWYEFKFVKYVE